MKASNILGLNFERVVNDIDIYCWDLDGTLGVYAFGNKGIVLCGDDYYLGYIEKYNPYEYIKPNKIIQRFIANYTNKDDNYVITVAQNDREKRYKTGFILKHYSDKIKPENIYFVDHSSRKYDVLIDISMMNKSKKVCLIDDTIKTLYDIQMNDIFYTLHISSFMSFDELLK